MKNKGRKKGINSRIKTLEFPGKFDSEVNEIEIKEKK